MVCLNQLWTVAVLVLFRVHLALGKAINPAGWENTNLVRTLDLQHAFTVETLQLIVKNVGTKPTKQYFIIFPDEITDKIAMLSANLVNERDSFLNCYMLDKHNKEFENDTDFTYGIVELPRAIDVGEEIAITIKSFLNVAGKPYPEHIELKDLQDLHFHTNRLPLSPYYTKQSTLNIISNGKISEVFEEDEPSSQLDDSLKGKFNDQNKLLEFGPFYDTDKFVESSLDVVYRRVTPLKEVVNLQRDVWVSHWASTIQFVEYYELTNKGAKLKNGFSRLEYMKQNQMMQMGVGSFIPMLEMRLPSDSSEHYLTDKVGMVSTTEVRNDNYLLKPRYPIFGGWFYNFTIGWTNPVNQFLRNYAGDDETYLLSVPTLNGPVDTVYDDVTVSIYLPEGAEVIDAAAPFTYRDLTITNEYSYFDLRDGHVKITFKFRNLFTDIGQANILVKYRYTKAAILKKPLSIAIYIFTALTGFFLIKSLNFNVNNKN